MIIAMDGPACAGKSTLAVMTAKALGIHFLNTGMIFRAIAYLLANKNVNIENKEEMLEALNSAEIKVEFANGEQVVYVNGVDTRPYVSLPEISDKASLYSQKVEIRKKVVEIQHEFAKVYDLVIEGRDIGTEVFPNAEHKFFVTASIDCRAERRYATLKEKGENITLDEVKEMLAKRDYNDSHREISPLKQAEDAILIDTSSDTTEESLQKIVNYVKG